VTADPVGATFAALSDPTRRHVVGMLTGVPEVTATELARDLPISRQAVAKHLAALHDAGIVASERQGRETRYRLTPAPLDAARAWLDRVEGEWDARLERLERHAGRRSRG
jgi:DNA-binding transcriptional ArsR family regulator